MAMIQAQIRTGKGTGDSRQLRRDARVPAVLYGGTKENRSLSLDLKELLKLLDTEGTALRTHRQDMTIDGHLRVAVLLRDYQIHPLTGLPLHVDFMRFDPNQIIHVNIPVHITDEAQCPGIKEGGIVELIARDVDVHCRAGDLPNSIDISVANMHIGDSVHLHDLQLPPGVETSETENSTVLTIVGVKGTATDEADAIE